MSISVVIPAFNAGPLLAEALDSVASQSLQPDEVIVVDDGGEDDSIEGARRHGLSPQVLVQPNAGVGAARNRGAYHAKGTWIAFLDQDDLWHRQHLELAIEAATAAQADTVVSGKVGFLVDDGSATGQRSAWADAILTPAALAAALAWPLSGGTVQREFDPLGAAVTGVTPTPSTAVVRREVFAVAGGFPTLFASASDVACWYQLSRLGPILATGHPTTYYRIHARAASESGSEMEVGALAAYVAMWYGNDLRPYEDARHRSALEDFGRDYAAQKLKYLLSHATDSDAAWRLSLAEAYETLLVVDGMTKRRLARLRAKRRFEILAPLPARLGRAGVRFVRRREGTG